MSLNQTPDGWMFTQGSKTYGSYTTKARSRSCL